ncbi:MAG: sigma factor [Brumimicrobium sp.]
MKTDFNQIWNEYSSHLLNFIKGKMESIDDAEDILQEVAIKFQQALRFQEIDKPKPWLFQVARNTIADFYRSQPKKSSIANTEACEVMNHEMSDPCVCELTPFVIENYLPEKYGLLLRMSDIENIPQKEIAQKMNLSLTATKTRIQRARKLLKEQVEDCVQIRYKTNGSIGDFNLKNGCELPPELLQEMSRLNL